MPVEIDSIVRKSDLTILKESFERERKRMFQHRVCGKKTLT